MIAPGVLPRPCLPWEPGERRLSLANHGIVVRSQPTSSLPFSRPRISLNRNNDRRLLWLVLSFW
jgi:hypothetical protein